MCSGLAMNEAPSAVWNLFMGTPILLIYRADVRFRSLTLLTPLQQTNETKHAANKISSMKGLF